MAGKEWYKDWFNSPFYHKLYFERDGHEAAAFMTRLIEHLHPKRYSYMLDVACGRGRHSRILAQKGFTVTGIDLSYESIAFAKKNVVTRSYGEMDNPEFYQHDMRLPFRVNYFDYAFNFFTSFGYFKTRREHDDAIRTIAGALKSGGIFVIDYLNVHYAEEHLISNEEKIIGETTYEIHRWHDETHFYKKIIISDPLMHNPVDYTEEVSKFTFGDFNDMLSYHGLQVQEIFGDYKLSKYDIRTTPRLIITAKKIDTHNS